MLLTQFGHKTFNLALYAYLSATQEASGIIIIPLKLLLPL